MVSYGTYLNLFIYRTTIFAYNAGIEDPPDKGIWFYLASTVTLEDGREDKWQASSCLEEQEDTPKD